MKLEEMCIDCKVKSSNTIFGCALYVEIDEGSQDFKILDKAISYLKIRKELYPKQSKFYNKVMEDRLSEYTSCPLIKKEVRGKYGLQEPSGINRTKHR